MPSPLCPRILLLALAGTLSGCISYTTSSGDATREVVAEGARERTVTVADIAQGSLTISASESWQRTVRTTTAIEGEFEVESSLGMIAEAPEMIVLSPVLLAVDVLALVVTGPVAWIESLSTGDEVYERDTRMTDPTIGLQAKVHSGSWSAIGETDHLGSLTIRMQEAAEQALHDGRALAYVIEIDGEDPAPRSLSLSQTVDCAALPSSESPQNRFAHLQGLLTKCDREDIRQLIQRRAERIDPATLQRYRIHNGLPAQMTLQQVDGYRTLADICDHAKVNENYADASQALQRMADMVAELDAGLADMLRRQSVGQSGNYVLHYYAERSLRSTPSFLVNLCRRGMPLAERYQDDRSRAVFSAVLAARRGDARQLVAVTKMKADPAVAGLQQRAIDEIRRQRAEAAYAAEVARIKREEEAWHYRYLNGRGGRGSTITSSGNGQPSSVRGPGGPSIAEQAQAHRAWLQQQRHDAANRNRAFDQFDRRD